MVWSLLGPALLGLGVAAGAPAGARPVLPSTTGRVPAGRFTRLGTSGEIQSQQPNVWQSATHAGLVGWSVRTGDTYGYEVATVAKSGKVGAPSAALSGWQSIAPQSTFVPSGSQPLLVFAGAGAGAYTQACVYGATGPGSPWALQGWSLSSTCANPVPAAAENAAGTIGAAWPGFGGANVDYHLGVSAAIPASGADAVIPVSTAVQKAGIAADASTGDFVVGWASKSGTPADGIFAEDVTAGGGPMKMPGTGTNSVNQVQIGNLAMAGTSHGVYVAGCTNGAPCTLRLWKVGAGKSLKVPKSSTPYDVALAPGPQGRLWVGWTNESTNTVMITRTNKAATRFGPVKRYHTGCFEHEVVGLSGPGAGAVDVGLSCIAKNDTRLAMYAAHMLPVLSEKLSAHKVTNTKARHLTVKVTDAGDPVKGSHVSFAGKRYTTNKKGKVTLSLRKGLKPGTYAVKATGSHYLAAHASLTVTT